MFEQLLSLVKENAGTDIINNNAIPNERNDEAVEAATQSVSETFKNAIQGGNVHEVMQLFNDGGSNVSSLPLAQNMQGNLIEKLMQKFGLSNAQAGGIAASLIPMVLSKLTHKTNNPNDSSFDLSSILSHFGGGNFDVGSVLSQFGLGNNDSKGANDKSGGLGDVLGGLFGK
ncbi:DUF937 domain-containing protein [Parafilimonas sp.]|uniref:DUF937 domain-containing protein n=1 Tax=Parafilimonas sp. TaxID=1969739 RepID=UPI0039E4EBF0